MRDLSSIIASWHVQNKCANHGGIGGELGTDGEFPVFSLRIGFADQGGLRRPVLPYEKALALARQEPERRFLARRLAELK